MLLAALLALVLPAAAAPAAPGDLDPSFGGDGVVDLAAAGAFVARAVAVDEQDRIVVAGYLCDPAPGSRDGTCLNDGDTSFRLARLTPDGGLDAEFGAGGLVTTPIGSGRSQALDVVVLGDGRIVAGGVARHAGRDVFALAGYRADGGLDPAFADGGVALEPVGASFSSIADLAPGPHNTIFAAGQAVDARGAPMMAVARFDAAGRLDTGFGEGGAALGGPGGFGYGLGVTTTADGGAHVAGLAGDSADATTYRFGHLHTDRSGAPDPRFGDGGSAEFRVGSSSSFANAAVTVGGGWLAAGAATTADGRQAMAAIQGRPDGTLDTAFAASGVALLALRDGAVANDVVVERGGRGLLVGQSAEAGGYGFATAALDRDGSVRWTKVVDVPGYAIARATAGALQAAGGLVTVGIGCVDGTTARCAGGSSRLVVARQTLAADRAAPRVSLDVAARAMRPRRLRGLRVRIGLSEPARLSVRLIGRSRRDGRTRALWATERHGSPDGLAVRLRPRAAELRRVRARVMVEARASDAAGNTATRRLAITMRR